MGLLNHSFLYCQALSSLLKIAECFSFRYLILDSAPAAEGTILSDLLSRLRIAFASALKTGYEAVFLMKIFLD
jgi:hypothetical protein